jgi:hypothetical protein
MPRKESKPRKLRPYRVDYFDVSEMRLDRVLVRSVVVRAVTANAASDQVRYGLGDDAPASPTLGGRVIIRSYRFYKKLVHRKDVYKAVEDLFTADRAVEVMEGVEAYRLTPGFPFLSNKQEDYIAGSADYPCDHGNATNAPVSVCTHGDTTATPEPPTTGPESPATKAVVADLQGMLGHDAHEQAMDTFQPTSVPEGKRFPDLGNAAPVIDLSGIDLDAAAPVIYSMPDPSLDYDYVPVQWPEPDYVSKGKLAPPSTKLPEPAPSKLMYPGSDKPLPVWVKVLMFGGVAALVAILVLAILYRPY